MLTPDVLPHWHAPRANDSASLLLRLTLGLMWLSHGLVLKLLTYGTGGVSDWLIAAGLPGAMAGPLILAETFGGVLILLGLHGRRTTLALLPIQVGALWIHAGNGWVFSNPDGGWEYPLFLIAASVLHLILGDGKYALRPEFRW